MERVRIENKTYVSRTLAATIGKISYTYLTQLCSKGIGPEENFIIFDRRRFYPISDVRRWAKTKPWKKPMEEYEKCGVKRRFAGKTARFEINLPTELLERFRTLYPNEPLGPILRLLLEEYLKLENAQ